MVLNYYHFIDDCSAKARSLFKLLSEQKTGGQTRSMRVREKNTSGQVRLSPDDRTSECQDAFDTLKRDLSHSVTLAQPDFEKPFIQIRKTETAVQSPIKLPDMIEAVGRAVGAQTVVINRNMENILEKLLALQRRMDRFGDQNGQTE